MRYNVLHDLPGRLRVHCRDIEPEPGNFLELERWLDIHEGLLSAPFSVRTGNLLVVYSRDIAREKILLLLDDLALLEAVRAVDGGQPRPVSTNSLVYSECKKACLSHAVGSLLPAPVAVAASLARAISRLLGLFRMAMRGEIVEFLFGALKFAVLAAHGKSLPVRLLLAAAGAVIRQSFAVSPAKENAPASRVLRYGGAQEPPLLPAPAMCSNNAAV